MSRYIFFEKPPKSLVFSLGEGRDVSQLRRSTQTHPVQSHRQQKNWAYFRFCILSFLNLRPSHLFLLFLTPTFGTTKLWIKKWSHSARAPKTSKRGGWQLKVSEAEELNRIGLFVSSEIFHFVVEPVLSIVLVGLWSQLVSPE